MVDFGGSVGGGYFTPMDREYAHHDCDHDHGFPASGGKSTGDAGVGIGDLGMSLGLGPVPNVHAVGAKLRGGSKTLEIGFFGMGKGSGQAQTPGMYGKKQRQALEEMGKANKVDFTTHTSVGVYGLAGMDRSGNFSKESKNMSVQEIKRAVEFAADVGRGGPVVVHTGEFQRSVVDADWNTVEGDPYQNKFQMHDDEMGKTEYMVVDKRSGGLIDRARKNRTVSRPVWKQYQEGDEFWEKKKGQEYTDYHGNIVRPGDYIDFAGIKITDRNKRVPDYDSTKGAFKIKQLKWEDMEEIASDFTKEAREAWDKLDRGEISKEEFKDTSKWARFAEAKSRNDVEVRPEEAFIISTLETNAANSRGFALRYSQQLEGEINNLKLEEGRLKKNLTTEAAQHSPAELEQLRKDGELRSEGNRREIKRIRRSILEAQEAAASQQAQAEQAEETIKYVESAETYALREAYDAYAKAGIDALRQTNELKAAGKLKKPIQIAMENLFPEQYGAHPDELIPLVKKSRDRMTALLQERGVNQKKAEELAKTHITATFDTGHLNMWRKYWKGDPKQSIEQNHKDFDKWAVDKVGQMMDAGIIGHVHIDDNHGYQDEHLAPGEGNTPIKEMISLLKKKGYKGELIVEPGADYSTDASGFHTMMKTWRHFNLPVYGRGSGLAGQRRTWGNVGYGYFGQTQPPYFTFGGYAPSEEWTLWSGVPLE